MQGPPEWHPAPDHFKAAAATAAKHARSRGCNLASLAIQAAVQQAPPSIATHLVGLATPQQVPPTLALLSGPGIFLSSQASQGLAGWFGALQRHCSRNL